MPEDHELYLLTEAAPVFGGRNALTGGSFDAMIEEADRRDPDQTLGLMVETQTAFRDRIHGCFTRPVCGQVDCAAHAGCQPQETSL